MNFKLLLQLLGRVLLVEVACMLLPFFISLFNGEDPLPFFYTILLLLPLGGFLSLIPAKRNFFAQEGFLAVGAIWVFFCLFGALPFLFSGYFAGYADCLFEITSAFSTTGATVLQDVEILPKGILFWRSFASWLGGMGVLIFTLAFLPKMGKRTHHLLRAEATGPVASKLVPKTADSSKILYLIYIALTVLEIICLRIAGMPLFDSVLHSFTTICTGGLSIKNLSIGAYGSPAIEIIVMIFVILSSINFAMFFLLLTKRVKSVLRSDELRWFLIILFGATALITVNIFLTPSEVQPDNLGTAFRQALFQASSSMSTTGFGVVDYDKWPEFSRMLLMLLMFVGGCAGSTSGGIKVSRFILLMRSIRRDIEKISHPRAVKVVKLDGKAVDDHSLSHVSVFFGTYMIILGVSFLLVSLDNFSFTTTVTAVFATLNNEGPGLALVGPMGNYSAFSALSKVTMSFCMLVGRLELFPLLLLFSPSTWRR